MNDARPRLHVAIALVLVAACAGTPSPPDVIVEFTLSPRRPVVGREVTAHAVMTLRDGGRVVGAELTVEGHMTHPGMAPVVVPMAEDGEGRYRAAITLTMAGEWVVFVSGQLADGQAVRQRVARIAAVSGE